MAAGLYNFVIEQGTTVDLRIDYKDSEGTPFDLTNFSARMQIRNAPKGSIVYAKLSSTLNQCGTGLNLTPTVGNKVYPKSSGSIGITISAASSSAFSFDQAYYDLEIVSGSGNCAVVTRLLQGKVKLSKEVTF
jgi:hypothetical protein